MQRQSASRRRSRRCGCARPARSARRRSCRRRSGRSWRRAAIASTALSTSVGRDGDLDLDLGQEVHGVFGAAVDFRVALLAPVALDLGHGHALHAEVGQRSRTSSSLNGLMTAITIFMEVAPFACARPDPRGGLRRSGANATVRSPGNKPRANCFGGAQKTAGHTEGRPQGCVVRRSAREGVGAESGYCTASPCRVMSRPMFSASWLTRNGAMAFTTLRITKVATAHQSALARDPDELDEDLPRIAVDQAGRSARRLGACRDRADGEHAGQQCAEHAADAVHAEHVERIVIAEPELELGAGPVADRRRRARR